MQKGMNEMPITIRLIDPNERFPITGRLAAHFSSDDITARQIGLEYRNAERVLLNPEQFPNADVNTLEWLAEQLFELSPTAALGA